MNILDFTVSRRGYTDVSLVVSQLYGIVLNGGTEQVYGTSASSPSLAAHLPP
jgi:hypothetical protein